MKLFVANKVSGEDYKDLRKELKIVCTTLKKLGNEYYCSFLDGRMGVIKTKKELILNAFSKIEGSDCIFAIVKSNIKSEGMLIEVGYAVASNKKFILAIKRNINASYLKCLADIILEFRDIKDLVNKLKSIKWE